ncbi:MAG: right-handed parallel beta-helix repeat-containing protein [bacterium]|nr:right-handed parallel beta-helix repeat-containing protein [bacterium]
MRRLLLLIAAALLTSALPSTAEEGRIPIFDSGSLDGSAGPISGRYVVTRDIVDTTEGNVIFIDGTGSENVDIDLNGFSLTGTFSPAAGDYPVIIGQNLGSLVVRDGSLIGDSTRSGFACINCKVVKVEDISVKDVNYGVALIEPVSFGVRRCVTDNTNLSGIYVSGNAATTTSGTIEDNLVENAFETGILVQTEINGVTVRRNRVRNAGLADGAETDGIRVATTGPAEITRNTVTEVLGWGIDAQVESCSITGNIIEEAGYDGILVAPLFAVGAATNCRISGNVMVSNDFYGLRIDGDGNQIDNNVMNNNAVYGIFFNSGADNNSYQGNIVVDNGTQCILDLGTGNTALAANVLAGSPAGCP